MIRVLVSCALLVAFPAAAAARPGFLVRPTGQATDATCQSYALGVALALKRDPAFKVDTASSLRMTEVSIRAEIKKAAGGAAVSHDHIKKGFESFTKGKYKLTFQDIDITRVGDIARERSGVTSVASTPPTFLLGAVVKDAVLASATKIDSFSYDDGHIFAILGADGPPNSNQKFLTLNSAVKVKDLERNSCVNGVPDDPGPYTASLSWKETSSIAFKQIAPGKIRLWLID